MYFKEFPTIPYDAEGNGKFKDVKNLLRRVGIRAKVKANTSLYDTFFFCFTSSIFLYKS